MQAGHETPTVQPPLPEATTGMTLASVSCWNALAIVGSSESHGCVGTPAAPVPVS